MPISSDDLRMAITALELEKAIYECRYELGNRPDWLWLPLSRLVRAA
jgi:predicted trehalose synthase